MFIDTILIDKKRKKNAWGLLSEIDKKVAYISDMSINNIRYGLTTKINYSLYEDLMFYKEILMGKICDSPCLCNISEAKIISKIKSLLNQTC